MKQNFGSGTDIVEGIKKFYDTADKSGVLKNNEKRS